MPVTSGKWYCEIELSAVGIALIGVGHLKYDYTTELGLKDGEIGWYQADGTLRINNTTGNLYGESFNNGDILGIALDMDNSRVYFSLNGVWQRGGTPETFGLPAATSLPSPCQILLSTHTTARVTGKINYGQYEFKHKPPSLYRPLGNSSDYEIDYSAVFDGFTGNGFLSKNYTSVGNRKKWTFSTWFKQASQGSMKIFGTAVTTDTSGAAIRFDSTDFAALVTEVVVSGTTYSQKTIAEYRDCKWHHLVWQSDTTQSTDIDRLKIFVDGKLVDNYESGATYPPQNSELDINTTTLKHYVGVYESLWARGICLAETHFIDGSTVDPVYFGTFKNNYWVPKEYSGSYGSNGFYLDYSNASDMGNDTSGNNNDYTKEEGPIQRILDTPTNDYCVWDRFAFYDNGSSRDIGATYSGSVEWFSLTSSTNFNGCYGTSLPYSGKYYWEIRASTYGPEYDYWMTGVGDNTGTHNYAIRRSDGYIANFNSGSNSATWSAHGSEITSSDVLCVAYDVGNNKLWFGKNGTWFNSGNPVNGTNPSYTLPSTGFRPFVGDLGGGDQDRASRVIGDFGQFGFKHTPPTGFKALSSQNFAEVTYTGDEYNILLNSDKAGTYTVISNVGKTVTTNSGIASSTWRTILANALVPDNTNSYWEVVVNRPDIGVGIATADAGLETWPGADAYGWMYSSYDGKKYHNGTGESYGDTVTSGSVIGIAVSRSNGSATIFFSKDGVWQNSAGGYTAYSGITDDIYPVFGVYNSASDVAGELTVNFGESGFYYPIPDGYKAFNHKYNTETNDFKPFSAKWLADKVSGHDYGFGLELYTGNSTNETKNIVFTDFKPDLIWIKNRSTDGDSHVILDKVRGFNREFRPDINSTGGFHEALEAQGVQEVRTNNFILGSQTARYNTNNENHVAWYWKSDPKWGVEIIEFVGDGSTPRQIPHNLGKVPEFWFVRNRERDETNWYVYHKNLSATIPQNKYLTLNTDGAVLDATSVWADTAPTSTHITVGNADGVNHSGEGQMMFLFTSIEGFSKMGTYKGNLIADGPFIYTGFRPAFIITKGVTSAKDWRMFDTKRIGYNNKNYLLRPATAGNETVENSIDIFSNGFKLTSTDGNSNGSNITFMYAAFAEQPIKYANAR